MTRYSSGVKSGEAPAYEEIMLPRKGQDVRHAPSRMPWYNPRYWRKRVWAGVGTVVVIIIIIIVAILVSNARKNRYPDYSPLAYSLADTCRSTSTCIQRRRRSNQYTDGGESFFDQFHYFTGYDPSKYRFRIYYSINH